MGKITKEEILVINCGSKKTSDIKNILAQNGTKSTTYYLYKKNLIEHDELMGFNLDHFGQKMVFIKKNKSTFHEIILQDEIESFNGIILSGGGKVDGHTEEYISCFTPLVKYNGSILGICFGHQILGLIHNTQLITLTQKLEGNFHVNFIDKNCKLFEGIDYESLFCQNHSEAITTPNNFTEIANSQYCIEAIKHQFKNFYGVQFHPEVSGYNGAIIINNFTTMVKEKILKDLFSQTYNNLNQVNKKELDNIIKLFKDGGYKIKIDSFKTFEDAIDREYLQHTTNELNNNGCDVDLNSLIDELRIITVPYFSFDNTIHIGQLVVNTTIIPNLLEFLELAFVNKFPIDKMIPMSDQRFKDTKTNGWSDILSMNLNNSSSFNLRRIEGTNRLSQHSYGKAVDFNPRQNPCFYVEEGTQEPKDGIYDINAKGTFTDKKEGDPIGYKLTKFLINKNWIWGGNWTTLKDNHHFQL